MRSISPFISSSTMLFGAAKELRNVQRNRVASVSVIFFNWSVMSFPGMTSKESWFPISWWTPLENCLTAIICHRLLWRNISRSKRIKEKRSALDFSSVDNDIVHSSVADEPLCTPVGCLTLHDRVSTKITQDFEEAWICHWAKTTKLPSGPGVLGLKGD